MTVPKGSLEWTAEHHQPPFHIAGIALASAPEDLTFTQSQAPALRAMDGSSVTQLRVYAADAPLGRTPMSGSFRVTLTSEQDRFAFEAAVREPVLFYPGSWWITDEWVPALAAGGPLRTSRRMHCQVPGIGSAAYQPQPVVLFDGVPAQVTIPTTNDGPDGWNALLAINATPARVQLRYPPELYIQILEYEVSREDVNALVVEIEAEELLPARFTLL